jgi:hypothetical protein
VLASRCFTFAILKATMASSSTYALSRRLPKSIGTLHGVKIHAFFQSDFPASNCSRMLRSGEAAEEIAAAGAFDLIVMPTHAGRFRRMALGSTTAKVINDAT